MSYRSLALVAVAFAFCIACDAEIDRPPAGEGGGGAGGAPPALSCPDVPGTWNMVIVPRPDGSAFCIDSREVTNEQYASYLTAGLVGQSHPSCESTDHTPMDDWPPAAGTEKHPVAWVTWCDAHAFCTAQGKRLCGDATGQLQELTDAYSKEEAAGRTETEMWLACTQGGAHRFVYGDEPIVGNCNDNALELLPADGGAACEGGYPNIFYLQGNALEWEGACRFEASNEGLTGAYCVARGIGGCAGDSVQTPDGTGLDVASDVVGFRCCADVTSKEP